jgi:polyisoprenoid-binding protein YceI
MKKILMALAAFGMFGTGFAQAENYKVDGGHAYAHFSVTHLGITPNWGRFDKVGGAISWDEADPTKGSFSIEIDATSISTQVKKRDDHLKGPDFFNVKQHPKLTFKSKKIEKAGQNKYKVTGDMTITGTTKEITVEVMMTGSGKDPWGNFRRGWTSTFTVDRNDYGIKFMPGGLGNDVTIMLAFEGIKG